MVDASQPPPGKTFLAAAGGGFVGGIVGAVAAATLIGNGDEGGSKASLQHEADQPQQVAVVERDTR